MTTPTTVITAEVLPTGGLVKLLITSADAGPWTLTRTVVSGPGEAVTTPIYSGAAVPLKPWTFIDQGDGTNLPLDQGTSYTWTLTTAAGAVTSAAVTPAVAIALDYTDMTPLMVKALQAALPRIVVPEGITLSRPLTPQSVVTAMPMGGKPTLPLVVINPDLTQQDQVPIGHGINTDSTANAYEVQEMATRRYSITVLTTTIADRDFYRDAVVGVVKALMIPLFESLGQNMTSKYQVASGQYTGGPTAPGFFYAEIGFTFTGMNNLRVTTSYGVIDQFGTDFNGTPF